MEYLENIVQLLLILFSLLVSLFRYIGSKKRGWLYAVFFFTSSLLSGYFWTAYLVIMTDSPNASDLLTYFGWNISYFVLALLIFHVKSREERRFFHPLMLLPIPLNLWQLHLYLQFGGALNNFYQVSVCTFISCGCIQGMLYYMKHRRDGARPPYIQAAVFLYVLSEFGMWTASCYEGWADYVYYLFSFLCSFTYLLFLRALRRHYAGEGSETVLIDRRIQNFLKISYIAIVVVCSLGGIVLGGWIRDVLTRHTLAESESEVYNIICVILFLISLILAAFAVAIILIVYFEQKIAENSLLREEKQVAERSNAAKSDFLANMSHEIRTPLNAVLGMNKMILAESLRCRENPPAGRENVRQVMNDITEYAGNIESAGNNLLSIINDILDFSKIEAGKLDLVIHEYQLSSVLNDVSNIILFRAKEKGLKYTAEIDESIPDRLCGDDMRIRQIITNLLNNAVKYTDTGSVTLSVRRGLECHAGETEELIIAVRDTGIGIREEELGKIFDKFERTDMERNSTVEGTGLGLAIAHQLIDMMGGSIRVESTYGKGSAFTVCVPQKVISEEPIGDFREQFEKSMEEKHNSDDLFRAPEARILIVDDTRMNLSVAAGLLKDTEIQCDLAESGAQALKLCQEHQYDVILLDQRMPVMDGTETLRRLRAQESSASVPVICLTADALTGAREHYMAEGFDDYLSKPIDNREMKQMLMKYLPEKKLLPVAEEHRTHQDAAPEEGFYTILRQAGFDIDAAMSYCQRDDELYRMLLREFVLEAGRKRQTLQRLFDERDAKNYGILAHALKSTARTIGAGELSKLAAALEKAADAEQLPQDAHTAMLASYDTVVSTAAAATGYHTEDSDGAVEEILEFFPDGVI